MEIKAKVPELNKEITVDFDYGANLDEAVEKFGPEPIYDDFVASDVITVQNLIRNLARSGKSDEEIRAAVANRKPGTSRRGKADPLAALLNKFGKMTPEKQDEFINKLLATK